MEGGAVSMSSIDDRIVNMQFNNAQFQQGIEQSSASLKDLNANLKLDNATQGIGEVQAAANHFSLANMESAVTSIASHFSVFGAAAFSVIDRITNAAIDAGKGIAQGIIDPLVQGGAKRALALQQAKFQFQGLGLDIQSTMDAALSAVKGTAFGLDEAATAAASFGATGINAGNGLADVLRSVAGVAAQSGSSYSNVAGIFETIAGNGKLMGEQLNQLSSYGVNAAAVLAKSLGKSEADVREMVTKGKISFQEFSDAMNASFGANAAKANETYTGALANMHAALARIGADVASPYFLGMRDIFNALGPLFDTIHKAIQPLLDDFAAFQSDQAVKGVKAINEWFGPGLVTAIMNVVAAIKVIGHALEQGFHKIFPDDTEAQLKKVALFLDNLTAAFIPGTKAADELTRTFAGLFAIFDIAGQIIGAFINAIADLFGYTTKGSGGILDFTAKVGDFLVHVDEAIKKGDLFKKFFEGLAGIIAVPIGILKTFFGIIADGVKDLGHFNADGINKFTDDVGKRFSALNDLAHFFQSFWDGVVKVATAVWNFLAPIFAAIGNAIHTAATKVRDSLKGMSFDDALQAINTGLFAGFLLLLRGFFGNLGGVLQGNGVAFVTSFKRVFGQLQLNLKALELNTNAKTLTQIAIAVALLAASAVALSLVDSGKLGIALGAIAGMMGGLIGTFAAFSKLAGTKGVLQMLGVAIAIEGIASGILLLSAAVAILGALPLQNLIQGTAAVVVILAALTGALAILTKMGPGVLLSAAAIAVLAPAMAVLAGTIAILGALPLANLIQGIAGFVVVLASLVGALALLNKLGPNVLIAAGALAILAPAIALLIGAIAAIGALPIPNLVQGLVAFIVVMGAMVGALALMDLLGPSMVVGAAALFIVAQAMFALVGAVALLGAMKMSTLIQGVVALAIVLAIMVGAILLLGATEEIALAGAAAIFVVAGALGILAPAMKLLGSMSWDDIGRGITVLAAALLILAVGGVLLIPAAVGFLLLGAAILLLGTGVYLAATGLGILGLALAGIVLIGAAGLALFSQALDIFIQKLPELGIAVGTAMVNMAVSIGSSAPQLIVAFTGIILAMLASIQQTLPAIIQTGTTVILAFVNALVVLIPAVVTAGLKIINGVLAGIAANIGGITTQAINIIVNFVNAISANMYKIISAAGNLVLSFINGLGDYVRNHSGDFISAGKKLFMAVVDGISDAIATSGSLIREAGAKIGNALLQGARNALGINSPSKEFRDHVMPSVFEGIEDGNDKHLTRAEAAGAQIGTTIADSAISNLKKSITGISDALDGNIDSTPMIRPVLDTSGIKRGAADITKMLPTPTLSLDTSNRVASSVSLQEQTRNAQLVLTSDQRDASTGNVYFTQNNTSPKALSTTELYRQTQNQLSTLKGELGVVDQSGSS
jgi:tape measure domain-containing protein